MPNGEDKKLNFTLKIWDATAGAYRPVYIAPDATDKVHGDVTLSDATDSNLSAADGMTAATPKAVKSVQDNANNKLDKTSSTDQTVASKVTFKNSVVAEKGVSVPTGNFFSGNLQGNSTTASTLQTQRKISVKVGNATAGSANFNGGADAAITIPQVDASVVSTGTLPLSVLPQGALERLVKVNNKAARLALTTGQVQLGDSVLQTDTNTMYIVVDINRLNSEDGYQEYAAGTAVLAETAEKVAHGLTIQKNGSTQLVFDGSANGNIDIASDFSDLTGQIAANQIPNNIITHDMMSATYAGSSTKGGAANSANSIVPINANNLDLNDLKSKETKFYYGIGGVNTTKNKPAGIDWFGMFSFSSGSSAVTQLLYGGPTFVLYSRFYANNYWSDWKVVGEVPDGSITTAKLANDAVTEAKLSNSSVTSAKIVDGTIVNADIADGTISGAKLANSTITGGKIAANAVTATNIANSTITNAKMAENSISSKNIVDGSVTGSDIAKDTVTLGNLANDIGTVAVQSTEPTDSNVKIWVQV